MHLQPPTVSSPGYLSARPFALPLAQTSDSSRERMSDHLRARRRLDLGRTALCVVALLLQTTLLPLAHALHVGASSRDGIASVGHDATNVAKPARILRAAAVPPGHDASTCQVCAALAHARTTSAPLAYGVRADRLTSPSRASPSARVAFRASYRGRAPRSAHSLRVEPPRQSQCLSVRSGMTAPNCRPQRQHFSAARVHGRGPVVKSIDRSLAPPIAASCRRMISRSAIGPCAGRGCRGAGRGP